MPESVAALAIGALTVAAGVAMTSKCSGLPKGNRDVATGTAVVGRDLPRHFSSRGSAKRHGSAGRGELIVAENVDEYRGAIASTVRDGDTVLEIGCHEGMTTYLLDCCCGSNGLVVGADKSAHWLTRAKARFPSIRFELIDCYDMGALLQLQLDIGRAFSVIFVDVSGSRELRSLIPLVEALECALNPEMIVVKSFRLARLHRRLQAASEYSVKDTANEAGLKCRAGSSAEIVARTVRLGNAMRAVQNERRRRAAAAGRTASGKAFEDLDDSSAKGPKEQDGTTRNSQPTGAGAVPLRTPIGLVSELHATSSKEEPRRRGAALTAEQKSGAEWSAVCWVCGVAKAAEAFSVRQQRQANSGARAQCKHCVAARRKSSRAGRPPEQAGA